MSFESVLLMANTTSTWLMCGVIWIVQVVHYPLFARYEREAFSKIMRQHQARIAGVVAGPMIVEFVTSCLLLYWRPTSIPSWQAWLGLVCVLVCGLSTLFVVIPVHDKLENLGFHETILRQLITRNWSRTIAWTLHAILCGIMLLECL